MPDEKIRRAIIGLQSRSQALAIYGVTAVLVGVAMTLTGAPGSIEDYFGTQIRVALGLPLTLGGVLVLLGAFHADRSRGAHYGALAGMTIFAAWATTMTIAYTWSGVHEGFTIAWPNESIPRETAKVYVPFLYQGIAALAGLHVWTFIQLGPPSRPVDSTT